MSCPYKDIFGAPDTGVHSYRFMDIAVVDALLTVLAAALFAWGFRIPFGWTLLGLFILGILLHRVFCVRTTLDTYIFGP